MQHPKILPGSSCRTQSPPVGQYPTHQGRVHVERVWQLEQLVEAVVLGQLLPGMIPAPVLDNLLDYH